MSSAIKSFEKQKQQALGILSNLAAFVAEGNKLGIHIHPDLVTKLQKALQSASEQKLKVALIGGFSEGKTSIVAAWLEELDRRSMNISQAESSSEVKIYEYKDQLQIIDTPGLFGFKEKTNATSQEIEKYKDITKHYVSEAHLVLYVMNPANPIKESHTDDLKWLFRTLNLLPRTVFVISRFDQVSDISDDFDFNEKFIIKKNSVVKRLNDVLALAPQEQSELSIVAVSANPFDMGVEHWLSNLPEFRNLSRIGVLQNATQQKIECNGGLLALAHETQKSIITDVITQQLPAAKEAYTLLADEVARIDAIKQSQTLELQKAKDSIGQAQVRLRGRVLRYFEDMQLQAGNLGLSGFNEFMHREVGNEGCLVQQHIDEIFSEEIGGINSDLCRIQMNVNNELKHYDDVLNAMSKKGVSFLSQPGVLTKDNVLLVRDGLNAATKMVGLDISKYLKFKPWGATKLANNLGSAVAIFGIGLELWDSYKEQERRAEFAKGIEKMIVSFKEQSKEIVQLINKSDFVDVFFPAFALLQQQLTSIEGEVNALQNRQVQFKKWTDTGNAIDVEFREINGSHQEAGESASDGVPDATPIKTPEKTSFWSKFFS